MISYLGRVDDILSREAYRKGRCDARLLIVVDTYPTKRLYLLYVYRHIAIRPRTFATLLQTKNGQTLTIMYSLSLPNDPRYAQRHANASLFAQSKNR